MKRLSFFPATIAALCLAIAGSVAFDVLVPPLSAAVALRTVMAALGLGYLVFLMRGGRQRTGRVTAVAAWLVFCGVAWFAAPTVASSLLMHALAIWLVRSLFRYAGVLPALLDLGVSLLGAAAAAWTLGHTGSVFLAAWSFFLVQALVAAVPVRITSRHARGPAPLQDDNFEQARRRADAAFRQLIVRNEHRTDS